MNSEFTIAVHSLVFLAYLPDHMASSDLIAKNVSTNPARIRKIMSCLRKGGFVKTKEGIGGGYILNGEPEDITLAQIYRTVSCGTIKPHWCTGDPDEDCLVSSKIQVVMDDIFDEADLYFERYLDQITIASVLKKIKQCQ
ncbi:Rrf2 family transcriptional regulator [Ammoniphilus sp. CFH 90114]|uniref:Rrf2 family transcriptional regulator n=1 Tax=Ammoniphilus sp. CFH 90114 TaxID=2493665 RepID=UPI00100E94BC|nr:Rrf2 family transcriptional regulator [Ammoniphilus sp. CFH 90114]RXT07972.1 Rrf2 family transcriptional regulator [Ammoniphilus sp. CFH 90114]